MMAKRLTDNALDEVAGHGVLDDALACNDSQAGERRLIAYRVYGKPAASCSRFGGQKCLELRWPGQARAWSEREALQDRSYTASRLRPFARRLLMTFRPPNVFMRARKPWVRARRTFEGWYVRFIAGLARDCMT